MASSNGQSVFDQLISGWKRDVRDVNGQGTLGISLPAEAIADMGIDEGDPVAITVAKDRNGVLELHFE